MSAHSLTVALVGSPNCGKTTLFNWLTGLKARAVNYAGSTVDCHKGQLLTVYGESLDILDTPGIYSVQPHGHDEEITRRVLMEPGRVGAVVVVVDGTQLNRQLYLIRQIQEMNIPLVVALTMIDLVEKAGRVVDLNRLSKLIGAPVVAIDGRLGGGVKELVAAAREALKTPRSKERIEVNWDAARIEKEIAVSEGWTREVVRKSDRDEKIERLRRWDRVLLHPIFGIFAFLIIMGALFSSIFWLAAPLMDLVDQSFTALAALTETILGHNLLGDFVANGLVSGFGAVMVFVPQIFILFAGLILLEDSGYLARAATIVDRPLHRLGLSGRAFVPILSGFACAVPAIMATRNIRSTRERWIAVFILPFMTCSARLPVYAILLTFLFSGAEAWKAGLALTGLYVGGLVLGAVSAAVLNIILKPSQDSHFLMELPFYRRPQMNVVIKQAWRRTVSYVKKAGPTIFTFVLVLWIGTHLPYHSEQSPSAQLRGSVVGQVGQIVEPVFYPMGLDWRAGLGMMSAFVAREVFVSSLAVIFSIADDKDSDSMRTTLLEKMREATFNDEPSGAKVFTTASVVGLIIYFMIALQCLSTTGMTWREMNSFKFAAVQLVTLNIAAYVVAVVVVQSLRSMGVA